MSGCGGLTLDILGGYHGHRKPNSPIYFNPVASGDSEYDRAQAERTEREALASIPHEGIRAGEVVGWRIWQISQGELRSLTAGRRWRPGRPMTGNPGAVKAGVYAFKDRAEAELLFTELSYAGVAVGSVEMWGEIIEHEHGYRASNAAIRSLEALAIPTEEEPWFFWFPNRRRRKWREDYVRNLRELYGVA